MIHYENLQKSLKRLQEQNSNYLELDENHPEFVVEGIRESVIQRFKTSYDSLWKVLRRYLTEVLGIAEAPNSPKPILRLANENDLLDSSLDQWFKYAQARVNTSYDYDGEKAKACLALVSDFIEDAVSLFCTMRGEPWA